MRGVPTFTVNADSVFPATALHSTAGEPYIVPSQGANVAGGKELLRIMLSTEAATNFGRTKLAPTVVAGLVPEDDRRRQLRFREDSIAASVDGMMRSNSLPPATLAAWDGTMYGSPAARSCCASCCRRRRRRTS